MEIKIVRDSANIWMMAGTGVSVARFLAASIVERAIPARDEVEATRLEEQIILTCAADIHRIIEAARSAEVIPPTEVSETA